VVHCWPGALPLLITWVVVGRVEAWRVLGCGGAICNDGKSDVRASVIGARAHGALGLTMQEGTKSEGVKKRREHSHALSCRGTRTVVPGGRCAGGRKPQGRAGIK
jgi:hypothetical protein